MRSGARGSSEVYDERQKDIDERVEEFEEEIEGLGERIERSVDRAGKRFEERYYETFGVLAPLLSSLLGLLFLMAGIWLLAYTAEDLGSAVLEDISMFLWDNLALLFGLMLISNHSTYLNKEFYEKYKLIHPIVNSFCITVFIWVLAELLEVVNEGLNEPGLRTIISGVQGNILIIFGLILVLSYIVMLTRERGSVSMRKEPLSRDVFRDEIEREVGYDLGPKRVRRSGRDKLLGGICGGLGEYFDVDPVLIRIIWIILAFASLGTAVLLYVILWIVIPRNPRDEWE